MSVGLGLGFVRPKSPALPAEVLSWNKQNFGRGLMVLPNSDIAYSREGYTLTMLGRYKAVTRFRGVSEFFTSRLKLST